MKKLLLGLTLLASLSVHADLSDLFSDADKKFDQIEKQEKLNAAIEDARIMLAKAKLDKEFTISIASNQNAITKQSIYASNGDGGICKIGTKIVPAQLQQHRYKLYNRSKTRDIRLTTVSRIDIKCLNKDGSLIVKNY